MFERYIRSLYLRFKNEFYYYDNNLVINNHPFCDISDKTNNIIKKDFCEVMIHEQYFYESFFGYQPDFYDKLKLVVQILTENGKKAICLNELIKA